MCISLQREFMWDIYGTKDSRMISKFIYNPLQERNLKDNEDKRNNEVSKDVFNQLYSAHYFSKDQGKHCL